MDADEERRKQQKPQISADQVAPLVEAMFGYTVVTDVPIKEVDSYDDRNFVLEAEDDAGTQSKFVFKVHNGVETTDLAIIKAQVQVINELASKGIACPKGVPLKSDQGEDEIGFMYLPLGTSNTRHAVRLLHYVEGDLLADVDQTGAVLRDVGGFLAKCNMVLADVEAEALKRDLIWDLRHFPNVQQFVQYIPTEEQRALVNTVFQMYEKRIGTFEEHLRKAVIQCDANDRNVLCNVNGDPNKCGIIDFGDCSHTWIVNEIAIAMAYIIIGAVDSSDDPVQKAVDLFQGYQAVFKLSEQEVDALYTLVAARVATSVTLGAFSYSKDPGNEYLLVHAKPGWKALELLIKESSNEAFRARISC